MKKIRIVIDPSHSNWILGWMFKEIATLGFGFHNSIIEISRLRNKRAITTLLRAVLLTFNRSPLLFTSITPLENFNKLNPWRTNFKVLFYTHANHRLLQSTINLLNRVDIIFCMNSKEKIRLIEYGVRTPIHNIIGAINPHLFFRRHLRVIRFHGLVLRLCGKIRKYF